MESLLKAPFILETPIYILECFLDALDDKAPKRSAFGHANGVNNKKAPFEVRFVSRKLLKKVKSKHF